MSADYAKEEEERRSHEAHEVHGDSRREAIGLRGGSLGA